MASRHGREEKLLKLPLPALPLGQKRKAAQATGKKEPYRIK
jgi:hypothetical protein